MKRESISSMDRVLTALSLKEPDRVPWFPLLTMIGARELGLSIKEYFSKGSNVAEAQLRMREKFGHDCLYSFLHASAEVEAWGGETIYYDEGPPNCGMPPLTDQELIMSLRPPRVKDSPSLLKTLDAIRLMKEKVGDEVPILSVVISPFSLPAMQMGLENYLILLHERPDLFARLMELNEEFTVEWGRAQVEAGSTAVVYFDPISSPTILPSERYRETGFHIAKRTISRIGGPVAMHFASGRSIPILDYVLQTGVGVLSAGCEEDLGELKRLTEGRIALVGNLNGLEMRRWSPAKAEEEVKSAIAAAGRGGGFILSDSHGEIPWQVSDDVILAMGEAVRRWGVYPLDWLD
ncbi:MAG: methylcobamide--CoM methyltransferase MtbA [Synergistaceae bacterium]|nr:uroporphyrinogen decarboxylase family protein [Synergistota bacterium]NLM70747.1 methylcobamide--CoM methyltransferase MtbA [Synergistaceae bacterium]